MNAIKGEDTIIFVIWFLISVKFPAEIEKVFTLAMINGIAQDLSKFRLRLMTFQ